MTEQVYVFFMYVSVLLIAKRLTGCVGGGTKGNTQKTVAIVVGVLAGFGLVIACLMVLKSACKKREGKYGG